MKNEFSCLRTMHLLRYWFWSFPNIKGWQQIEAPCSITVTTGQAYCALRANTQTMSPRCTWDNYEVLKQEDREAWHQDLRFQEACFKYRMTQTVHIFHAEMFSVKNQPFFKPPRLHTPNLSRSLSLFFRKFCAAFYWLVLASEIHNTLLVSGSPTPRRGIPLLSLLLVEMNEFVQSAQVWIQTLILPWQAATTRTQKHYKPFIPANTEAGRWHPPGYLGAQGAASSSLLLLPLNINGAVRIFIIYWFTQRDTLCTIGETEKQANTTNRESCKTYRSQETVFPFLCFSFGWSPKQANTRSFSKPRNRALKNLPLWSVLLFSHEGAPISRDTFASHHTGSQYWSN